MEYIEISSIEKDNYKPELLHNMSVAPINNDPIPEGPIAIEGTTTRHDQNPLLQAPPKFNIDPEKLATMVTGYQQRAPDKWEDLRILEELGDTEGVAKLVNVDLKMGLSGKDASDRRFYFGSNMRPPAAVRGFCKIICDVLEDLLLRADQPEGSSTAQCF